jgi:hypothetical protein
MLVAYHRDEKPEVTTYLVEICLVVAPRALCALEAKALVAELQTALETSTPTCVLGPEPILEGQAVDEAHVVVEDVAGDRVFNLHDFRERRRLTRFEHCAGQGVVRGGAGGEDLGVAAQAVAEVLVVDVVVAVVVDGEGAGLGCGLLVQAELGADLLCDWRGHVVLGPHELASPACFVDLEDVFVGHAGDGVVAGA